MNDTGPRSSRDFLNAAKQRLSTAEFLVGEDYTLDGVYLAGYAIECSLKALILHNCDRAEYDDVLAKITSGAKMHEVEVLSGILKEQGLQMPLDLVKKLRRFKWSVSLRYQTGRKNTGEARGFLKTATTT